MTVVYLIAAAITLFMTVNVLLWKRAGVKNPDREHDPLPVTFGGAIATFTVGVSTVILLWWALINSYRAWRGA